MHKQLIFNVTLEKLSDTHRHPQTLGSRERDLACCHWRSTISRSIQRYFDSGAYFGLSRAPRYYLELEWNSRHAPDSIIWWRKKKKKKKVLTRSYAIHNCIYHYLLKLCHFDDVYKYTVVWLQARMMINKMYIFRFSYLLSFVWYHILWYFTWFRFNYWPTPKIRVDKWGSYKMSGDFLK